MRGGEAASAGPGGTQRDVCSLSGDQEVDEYISMNPLITKFRLCFFLKCQQDFLCYLRVAGKSWERTTAPGRRERVAGDKIKWLL